MERIQEIERLLHDDGALDEYLAELERVDLPVPETVAETIRARVRRKRKRFYADIAKVAACLVLSLSVSNAEFVICGEGAKLTEMTQNANEKISDFYGKLTFGKDGLKGE